LIFLKDLESIGVMKRAFLSLLILLGGFLHGCADLTTDATATLRFPDEDSAVIGLLFDEDGFFRVGTSVRVIFRYEGLPADRWVVDPPAAAPTFTTAQGAGGGTAFAFFWQKASDTGFDPIGGGQGFFRIKDIPIRRRALEIGVEFIQQFGSEFFVVAYGCYLGPRNDPITEEQLQADLQNQGIFLFAGRTCGQCSPNIREAAFAGIDNPAFTEAALAIAAPLACGAYE